MDGQGYSVWDLLSGKSYRLDYFQRNYVWEESQVGKLIEDLSLKFQDEWSEQDAPEDVRSYDPYFLGPFVTYKRDGRRYLADGQQRFITLLLLLIHLRRLLLQQDGYSAATTVSALISNHKFGKTTFAVDAEAFYPLFEAFYNNREYSTDGAPPHIVRAWAAYQHIRDRLPRDVREESLPYFVDWLLHRVSFVEIEAGDPERAWEIFQSMNDRGLHLKPIDHLKGYLLQDAIDRTLAEEAWQRMVSRLESVEVGSAFAYIQAVLRARFSNEDRVSTVGSTAPAIAGATHEWVRSHEKEIWPNYRNGDRAHFVTSVLGPYSETYRRLLRAKGRLTRGFESVYFNTLNGIAQQFDLSLACIAPNDTASAREHKSQLVANFVDLFVVRNAVNNRKFDQEAFDEVVSRLLPRARLAVSIEQLRAVLAEELVGVNDDLAAIESLRLRDNYAIVHYLLVRMTAWVDAGAERGDLLGDYLARREDGRRRYQIEHLLPQSIQTYRDVFADDEDYQLWRSRLGGLALLDGPENASFGAASVVAKVDYYANQNYLIASLSPAVKGRGFARLRRFVREQKLQAVMRPYDPGKSIKELIELRGRLYRVLAERIWDPAALGLYAAPSMGGHKAQGTRRARRSYGVTFEALIRAGLLREGEILVGYHRERIYKAIVSTDGRIQTASGGSFDSPSAAAMDALNRDSWNGWTFWRLDRTGEGIDEIRARFLARGQAAA